MKYIEELSYGSIFYFERHFFILTSDIKQRNNTTLHLCIQIGTGSTRWLSSDTIVEIWPIFYQNQEHQLHYLIEHDTKTNI